MQGAHFLVRAVTAPLAGLLRHSALAFAAAVVAACGGGGGTDAVDPPGGDPGPAAIAFQLSPARLPLSTGGTGRLLALQAPGAIAWSSSDPTVASVDAEGQVSAVAAGNAVITATVGTAIASSRVAVFAPTAASSATLIETALAQGTIDAEQALTYRVYALFADPRLPAQFEGGPEGVADHALMRQLSVALPTLSAAGRDRLAPFLVPPIYAGSWFQQRMDGTAPAAAGTRSRAAAARSTRAQVSVNCEAQALPTYWKRLSTAHFNIFHLELSDPTYNTYYRAAAEAIAAVVEEVYTSETGLLERFPLADTAEACNGGDGAVDIYVASLGHGDARALTTAYPDRCNHVPSFIVVNSNDQALQQLRQNPPEGTRELKAILAHEFAHVLQFAMDRGGATCDDYEWLDEATAEWAMDYVDPTWNREDGAYKAAPAYQRSGKFYAQYLYSDHMASIEKPGLSGNRRMNGYADYIFFQYLARKYDAQTIKAVFDATVTRESVEAVEAALAPKGGMRTVWPEFALTLWNDKLNQNLDDFARWDAYDFGLAPVLERRDGVPPAHPEAQKLKSIDVDQQGRPRESFKMLKNALDRPGGVTAGDFYEIQPRSIFYEHLKFTDPTVSSVYFFNPIGAIPSGGFIKVQARKKIGGEWKATEDWTQEPYKQFCLDKKDERIEELLIVVSNSEVNRGAEVPFRFPKLLPMLTSSSNVGCWKWLGEASVAISGGTPVVDSRASGVSMLWVVSAVMPGRIAFGPSGGVITGNTTITDVCTTTMVGASRQLYRGLGDDHIPKPDGTIDFNLDLDLGFSEIGGESPNRELITLSGTTTLDTTTTAVCPAVTTTAVAPHPWSWLTVDTALSPDPASTVVYSVAADGKTIEGRFTGVSPTGSMINTLWKFTAVRE